MTHFLIDPATVDRRRLANGLTAIVRVDRSAPVVALVTYLKVGYFDEPDELAGISHVLEHMFFKGTATRGPGQIGQETKAAGGYLNAATIYDHTSYYTVLPARSLEDGLAIQSDALLNSVLDADELQRELQVIIQEARRKLDTPSAVAQESLYELMYDRHRMRRWRIGTEEFLTSLTRAQLWEFYRDMYRGARAILVVSGDVDPALTHDLIERHYGALPAGQPPLDRGPQEPARSGLRFREKSGDIVHSHLEWGWPTCDPLHDDSVALDLLGLVLGQGRAARLYRSVRETGLVHSIGARHYTPTELGAFLISAELDQHDARAALSAIAETVDRAGQHIGDGDVDRARSIMQARAIRRLESMEGQANHLAEWEALGDWQLGGQYYTRIGALTASELRAVAQRYLQLERAAVFLYRPEETAALGDWRGPEQGDPARAAPVSEASTPGALPRNSAGPAPSFEHVEDDVHFFRTSAGVSIVIKRRGTVPLASLTLAVPGGPSLEDPARAGFTALSARASIKGTQRRSAAQLAMDVETLGTTLQPGVGADLLDWSLTVQSKHPATALELLLDAALGPVFPEDEVEKEKKIALADLQQVRDDMYRFPLRLFMSAAFPDHAYGLPLERAEAAIESAGADALRAWHKQVVRGRSPTVLVVGDVEPEWCAQVVAGLLDQCGSTNAPAPPAHWPGQQARVSASRQKAQTALVLGFPGVTHTHPDAVVLQVLANTVAGLGGRLFEELRSRRALAYTVTAHSIARAQGGAFVGYIATAPEREEEARRGLLEELGRLREELLPAADVERARRYTIGAWQIRSQTNAAQLSDLMHALLLGRGMSELRDFVERVEAVTPEQLREAAQRYFDEDRLVEAVVRGTGARR